MSGFVATAPASATEDTIANDGFFPDLSVSRAMTLMRVDGSITAPRLREALVQAMVQVNQRLADYQRTKLERGFPDLAECDTRELDGERRTVLLYRRAVHALAKADLIERYRDFDSSGTGVRRGEDMAPSIDDERRNATWAIRQLLDQSHSIVELF